MFVCADKDGQDIRKACEKECFYGGRNGASHFVTCEEYYFTLRGEYGKIHVHKRSLEYL